MDDCGTIMGIQNRLFCKEINPGSLQPKLQLFKMEFQALHHIVTRSI